MKKTWKCWLGTVAAAMLGTTVMAQPPQSPAFGSDLPFGDEGAVRLGDVSGSATTGGPLPAQFDLVQPLDADAIWEEAPRAYQGAPPPGDETIGFASAASYADVQWRVGRVNNDMYGFDGGYTTLNAFIPLASDDRNLWFMDPRLNITDFGEGAANFGLGYRRYSYAMDRIFGVSAWYDYDPGHRSDYHQLGLSLENIGRYFSTRVNANVPLTDQNDFTTANSFGNPFFTGNNIGYIFSFLRETSYQNYTVEAAAPVPFFGRYGWEWAISGYGLVANGDSGQDAVGVGGRFEWQVAQDFWINTTITHDRIFGTNTSINFELTIPSGKQTRWLRPMRVHDKILASVKRPYRVSTSTAGQSEQRLFLDPNDGAPIVVAHINPQSANGAAAGSVENPFGSVQDYMNLTAGERSPFDIIYVGGNLLATNDADLNTTIELLDRQRLLGTGALADGSVHQFQTIARNGVGFETLDLPNFGNSATPTNTGPNPLLSNSGAAGTPVVRINGNYTEVSGFTIDAGGTADGIATVDAALAARTVDSFVITNNTIQSAIQAMDIRSNTSPGATGPTTMPDIRSLTFDNNIGIISNNTISGLAGTVPGVTEGIVVVHSGGVDPLNLRVASNQISNVTDEGIDLSVTFGTIDASDTNFGILSNTITASGVGVLAQANGIGATFNLAVEGNNVTNSTDVVNPLDPTVGAGMIFLGQGLGTMNIDSFLTNTSTGNAGRGASFVASGGFLNIQPAIVGQIPFRNNTFTGNADDGVLFGVQNLGSLNVGTVAENVFSGNGGDGVDVRATSGGIATIGPIVANAITGNQGNGVNGLADAGTMNVQIGTNTAGVPQSTINGNVLNGINYVSANGGTFNSNIQNVAVTGNGANGIRLASSGGSTNVNIDGTAAAPNLITGNIVDGVAIVGTGTGTVQVGTMTFNTITGNGGDGIDINIQDDATANLNDVSANGISNANGMGIRVNASDTSAFFLQMGLTGATVGDNLLTGNSDAGIGIQLFDTAVGNVNIAYTDITGTTNAAGTPDFLGDGVRAITNDSSRLDTFFVGGTDPLVPNVNITGNAGRGVALETRISSVVVAPTIRNSVISNNGLDGIELNRFANSKIDNILIQNNDLVANGQDGIEFNFQGGRVDIENAPAQLIIDALIVDNIITGAAPSSATSDGIAFNLEADVLLNANIANNSITAMGNAGIVVRGQDDSNIDGFWTNNTIRGNGLNVGGLERDGINITLTERAQAGLNSNATTPNALPDPFANFPLTGPAFPAAPAVQAPGLVIDASEISGSGRDGIRIEAGNASANAADANIQIQNNIATVADPLDGIYGNAGSGVHVISQGGAVLEDTDVRVIVNNNAIRNNALDGIHVEAHATLNGTEDVGLVSGNAVLTAVDNDILNNTRHGVNLETEDNSLLFATLQDNNIALNGRRGVSLLNRHNAYSSLVVAGTVNPVPSGGTVATSRIEQNGEVGLFVVNDAQRIDTINSISLSVYDTAIVGNGTNGAVTADERNGFYIRTGTSSFGTIEADVQRNFMSGNGNNDFVTESFVSVPQAQIPVVSPYPNPPAGYRLDPLARLSLRFIGNAGDQIDVTRQGAFYNNADQFKSPAALFDSTSRRRNAQRLDVDYPPGVAGDTNPFVTNAIDRTVAVAAANVNTVTLNAGVAGQLPNNTFLNLGVRINGGALRNVTGFNAANNTLTFDGGAVTVGIGSTVEFEAINIAGVGASTFRTTEAAVNINNVFTTIISDFNDLSPLDLGAPSVDNNPLFNGNSQDFGWEILDPNAPVYAFP